LLNRLRDVGVSIAIHDFGSAYSSLGSLRVLPINAVKIDRSLITTIHEGDLAIVNAVIDVSGRLGLRVSAAGVDTREQFELLKRGGCDEAQGLYFSPPVDEEKFAGLMVRARQD